MFQSHGLYVEHTEIHSPKFRREYSRRVFLFVIILLLLHVIHNSKYFIQHMRVEMLCFTENTHQDKRQEVHGSGGVTAQDGLTDTEYLVCGMRILCSRNCYLNSINVFSAVPIFIDSFLFSISLSPNYITIFFLPAQILKRQYMLNPCDCLGSFRTT